MTSGELYKYTIAEELVLETPEYERYRDNVDFKKCFLFVKDHFPHDDIERQFARTEASYLTHQLIFNLIMPEIISQAFQPSLN